MILFFSMKAKIYFKEVQFRIFFILLSIIFNFSIIYHYKEQIIFLLGQHQTSEIPHFITTNLPEMFFCLIKFTLYLAFYSAFPIVVAQFWFFFAPAFYKYEYKIVKNFSKLLLLFFFISNFLFCTKLLPYCWKFFSGFQLTYETNGINVQLETRLHEYLEFLTEIIFSLNLSLNFCVILSFLLIKLSIRALTKLRKIIYFCSFLLATIVTPPDIISQILTGNALILSYEIFIFSHVLMYQYKKGE